MKRRITILTLLTLSALPVLAQPGPRSPASRLDYLAGYLSLTDAQKTQAQAIFTAAQSAAETARGQMDSARTALSTAIKANASESELDRLAAAIGAIEGQLAAIHAKAEAKFYALLTAEQRTKYDARGNGRRGSLR